MLKILVADYSALMRSALRDIINSDKAFHVIDISQNGEDAYNKIKKTKFDLVVMEMRLPKMDGLQVLEKLRADGDDTKVVVICTSIKEEVEAAMRALELGACDFVVRTAKINGASGSFAKNLLTAMRAAVETGQKQISSKRMVSYTVEMPKKSKEKSVFLDKPELIALACSTGGPNALHTMLPMLPKNLSVPLVLVQHMPAGFTAALANRLNQICAVAVKEAEDGEILKPGCVYIAPGGRHMEIKECGNHKACISINDSPPVNNLRPCADLMYKSLVKTSYQNILCVVLTGMGTDGTKGILELQKHKNIYVITESKETCVVYGMPKSIVQKDLADETVPIYKISDAIIKKTGD